MEEHKQRIKETLKGIQERHKTGSDVSSELVAMLKEVNTHFKQTIKKIERAEAT